MDIEIRWLKEQITLHKDEPEILKLRQSQLDTIKIVFRQVIISPWSEKKEGS